MERLSIQLLPEYTPSTPAPDYSSSLLPGEKCIQKSPRLVSPHADNTSFTYQDRGMTLTLNDCRGEDGLPTFGLGSIIRGEVALDHRQRVVSVAAKVCGFHRYITTVIVKCESQLEGRVYLRGQPSKIITLVSKERTLWESSTLNDGSCPGIMPLSMPFPASYRERGQTRSIRLPPSFEVSKPQSVAIVYTLQIIVTKSRNVPVIGKKLSR